MVLMPIERNASFRVKKTPVGIRSWRCIIWRMRSICSCGFLMGTVCNFPFICHVLSRSSHYLTSHPPGQQLSSPALRRGRCMRLAHRLFLPQKNHLPITPHPSSPGKPLPSFRTPSTCERAEDVLQASPERP